jgi:thiamine biosynthesis protein ThiI
MKTNFCILIHYHEIALKGNNRIWFEKQLIKNIKYQFNNLPYKKIKLKAARIFCFGIDYSIWDQYQIRLKKIIGVRHSTLMQEFNSEVDEMKSAASESIKDIDFNSFRISAKRQDKTFNLTSQEINEIIGKHIQNIYSKEVSLKNPDIDIIIEIVDGKFYLGFNRVLGYGGLPVKTGEQALSMISSGIDSPVSSFEMLKRGVYLTYVHFHSAPSTSRQSIQNVEEILGVLAGYQMRCKVYMVPLLEIQQKIMAEAPNKLWVILFRRAMIKLASVIADKLNIPALVSGESVGQVASQTLSNIRATSDAADRPILRPLCGHNKDEIVQLADQIGTYKISIQPYDDCCSFFVPLHPETKAKLEVVLKKESEINFKNMFNEALSKSTEKIIEHSDYIK